GWGVGDMGGAIETTLAVEGVTRVLVLCGRSEALMARLRARFGSEERVELLGFTERMSELMGAADALVHSTAGLTVLEAWIRGCLIREHRDRRRTRQYHRAASHRYYGGHDHPAAQRRARPALAAHQRGQQHRHDDLDHEDHRADMDGRSLLERGHLEQQSGEAQGCDQSGPQDYAVHIAAAQVVDQQLADDPG